MSFTSLETGLKVLRDMPLTSLQYFCAWARFSCNSGRKITADELARIGTYNAFIGEHPLYSASKTSVCLLVPMHERVRRRAQLISCMYLTPELVTYRALLLLIQLIWLLCDPMREPLMEVLSALQCASEH